MPSQNRQPVGRDHDGEPVAGDREEAGLAEVQQAGVAEVHVEPDGGEREDDGLQTD